MAKESTEIKNQKEFHLRVFPLGRLPRSEPNGPLVFLPRSIYEELRHGTRDVEVTGKTTKIVHASFSFEEGERDIIRIGIPLRHELGVALNDIITIRTVDLQNIHDIGATYVELALIGKPFRDDRAFSNWIKHRVMSQFRRPATEGDIIEIPFFRGSLGENENFVKFRVVKVRPEGQGKISGTTHIKVTAEAPSDKIFYPDFIQDEHILEICQYVTNHVTASSLRLKSSVLSLTSEPQQSEFEPGPKEPRRIRLSDTIEAWVASLEEQGTHVER